MAYLGVGEGDGSEEMFPSLHVDLGGVTVVSTAERLHELQARVGNLSPRGSASRQQERKGKDTMAALNLDPVLVTNSSQEPYIPKLRGNRAHFPSDRTLRSMASSSRNSFALLSDD